MNPLTDLNKYDISNAKIKSFSIYKPNIYMLSVCLTIEDELGQQAFGSNIASYLGPKAKHHKTESQTGHFIFSCLEIADVENINDLKGKAIRVAREKTSDAPIKGIGHIFKQEWFFPETVKTIKYRG